VEYFVLLLLNLFIEDNVLNQSFLLLILLFYQVGIRLDQGSASICVLPTLRFIMLKWSD
jgi:hypothetical protein